jgi:hypothetical protein
MKRRALGVKMIERLRGLVIVVLAVAGCEFIGTDEGNRDGTCGQHSSCPHDQACSGGNCLDMLGRTYRIETVEVDACDRNLDGISWDTLDGSLPDLKVEVRFKGEILFASATHDNTLSTTFNLTDAQVMINDFDDGFVVEVRDADLIDSELMDTVAVEVDYPGLRAGVISARNSNDCSESPVTDIELRLVPTAGAW